MLSLLKLILWIFPGCFGLLWNPFYTNYTKLLSEDNVSSVSFLIEKDLDFKKNSKKITKDILTLKKFCKKRNKRFDSFLAKLCGMEWDAFLELAKTGDPWGNISVYVRNVNGADIDKLATSLKCYKVSKYMSISARDINCYAYYNFCDDWKDRPQLTATVKDMWEAEEEVIISPLWEYSNNIVNSEKEFNKKNKIVKKSFYEYLDRTVSRLEKEVA